MMYSISDASEVLMPEDVSRGSSVSSGVQEEYDELLKYALITPGWSNTSKENRMPEQLRLVKPDEGCSKEHDYSESGSAAMVHFFMEKEQLNEMMTDEMHANEMHANEHQCPINCDDFDATKFGEEQSESIIAEKLESHYLEMQCAFKDFLSHSSMGRDRLILEKVAEMKDSLIQRFLFAMQERDEIHQKKTKALQDRLEQKRNLTKTMEDSLGRKDKIIDKLMQTIRKLKEKVDLAKAMASWKSDIADKKRLEFCDKIAKNHRNKYLLLKTWTAWHNIVKNRWKKRIEKACQGQVDDTIRVLIEEYEVKLSKSDGRHASYEKEIEKLRKEKERMAQGMQKAFMRGVCALNYEARSIFNDTTSAEKTSGGEYCGGMQQEIPNGQYSAAQQSSDLPYSFHRKEVVRQGDSQVHEPILTTTTQRRNVTTTTTTSRQPKLVKGLPSRPPAATSKDETCTDCPNKDTHPCQDVYSGLKPCGMTGRYVKAAQLLPVPRENRPKKSPHPILVERHTSNVEHAVGGRTLVHVKEYRNASAPAIPPTAVAPSYRKTACYTIGRSLPK